MINIKLLYKILGSLLYLEAAFTAVCLAVAFYYHEDDMMAFTISLVVMLLSGIVLHFMGHNADSTLSRRDAYLVVTLTWIVFSIFGALPFTISGYIDNYTDAYFETMSGFTTTGASIIDDVERLPHGLLFWRSLTQWIGGLGILFFTIAILPSMVGGTVKVFAAEATGPIRTKIHPRLTTTAKWIWSIYLLLTIGCGVLFYIFGMDIFDSINYSMTVTATGGFATHNESTGFYHEAAIDYTAITFMFLSGVSFTMLYAMIFKGRIKQFFNSSEFKLYCFIIVMATTLICYFLLRYNDYTLGEAFKNSLFQVVSFITTTGVFNDDAAKWNHITWVILSICMFFGGCSGSTAGGFKCVRGVMVLKIMQNELKKILHPKAVLPVRINDNNVHYSSQLTLLAYFAAYFILCLVSYFIMILAGVDSTNSITIALSCGSNVGPTLGLEIGPTMSWSILPQGVKWLLSVLMLMGRLEIFTVVVLFTPAFWKDN